jgi:hypothetical protein
VPGEVIRVWAKLGAGGEEARTPVEQPQAVPERAGFFEANAWMWTALSAYSMTR